MRLPQLSGVFRLVSSRSGVRPRLAAVTAAASVVVLATCQLDQLTSAAKTLSVALTQDTVLVVGATQAFSVVATGGAALAGARISWASSQNAVATVDTAGVVTATGEGSAVITATVSAPELPPQGLAVSRTAVVGYAGLVIAPIDSLTGLGQTATPVVDGKDVAGAPKAVVAATLNSSDSSIVAVAGSTVVARKNGTATITATYRGLTATVSVKVRQVAKRITFGASPFVFTSLGRDTSVALQVFDTHDSVIAAPAVTWSSSNTGVATVTAAGVMRALEVAADTMRAASDTVTSILPVSVRQSPALVTKTAGDAQAQTVGTAVPALPTVNVKDAGGFAIAGAQVTFAVTSGGGSVTGALQTTAANGNAAVGSWTLGTAAGSDSLRASVGALSVTFVAAAQPGAPAQLAIQQAPASGGSVGASLSPALTVAVRDGYGNLVTGATNAVTVALGANPGSATLGGTLTESAAAGVATFADLTISAPSAGYTLAASASGLTGATTAPFSVLGPAAKLAFTTQPASVVAGSAITPGVQVSVEDAAGQALAAATNSVTLAIGTNPGNGTLSGTATQAAVNGVATFGNLSINKADTGYTLTASATGLTGATSGGFAVTAGAASKLAFAVQPTNTPPSTAIAPPVQVAIQDALGNTVPGAANQITLALGTNPAGGTLSGGGATAASSGVATFSNLQINTAGNGYTLVASAAGLTSATSAAFNILGPGTPRQVRFVVQPTATVIGAAISPSIKAKIVDSVGTTVTSSFASVTISIGNNSGGASLGGTTTVNAVAGVATFSGLTLSQAGAGYTLVASSSGLGADTSTAFDVAAFGAEAKLAFVVQPTNADSNTAIAPAVQVAVEDAEGNIVTSATDSVVVALQSNPSSASLGGTLEVPAVSGIATFGDLTVSRTGNGYTLAASTSGLTSGISTAFNVENPNAAAKLAFVQQPTSTTAGSVILPAVTVAVQTLSGVTVTSDNSTVVSLAVATGPGSLRGVLSATAVNGIATFGGLSDTTASSLTLVATAPPASGLTPATSASFVISAGPPSELLFLAPPASVRAGDLINPVLRVAVADQYGNTVPSATNQVTLSTNGIGNSGGASSLKASGVTGPTLAGATSVAAIGGVASFADLRIRDQQVYILFASATNLSATAVSITVTPSTATQVWLWSGADYASPDLQATANFSFVVSAFLLDSLFNEVGAGDSIISLSIGTNAGGGTLTTANNRAAVNGRVDFTVTLDKPGNGYTLVASSAGLASLPSWGIDVAAFGSAARLVFGVQPSNVGAGAAITPGVQVCVQDGAGNLVTNASGSISVALGANPTSATLGGTLTQMPSNGCATFPDLTLSKTGTGFTLTASSSGLAGATSNPFNVQ